MKRRANKKNHGKQLGWWPRLRRRILMAIAVAIALTLATSVLAVLFVRAVDPLVSSVMLQDWAERSWMEGGWAELSYRFVPYHEIAAEVPLAVIAAEDQLFPRHDGFDFRQIYNAIEHSQSGGVLRGASTISQQVAKNLFLWKDRSLVRKAAEAYFTVLIEALWSKQRILEVYLNVAQMGRGIYGVGAAADIYFDRAASALEVEQAALLAAVLPNPVLYQVREPSARVLRRKGWILSQMKALGGVRYLRKISID